MTCCLLLIMQLLRSLIFFPEFSVKLCQSLLTRVSKELSKHARVLLYSRDCSFHFMYQKAKTQRLKITFWRWWNQVVLVMLGFGWTQICRSLKFYHLCNHSPTVLAGTSSDSPRLCALQVNNSRDGWMSRTLTPGSREQYLSPEVGSLFPKQLEKWPHLCCSAVQGSESSRRAIG